MRKMDSIRQPVQWLNRGEATFPKTEASPKEDHGDDLVVVSRFDPLQFPESRRNHYGREVSSRNQ